MGKKKDKKKKSHVSATATIAANTGQSNEHRETTVANATHEVGAEMPEESVESKSLYSRHFAEGETDCHLSIDEANALISEYLELATQNRVNQGVEAYLIDALNKPNAVIEETNSNEYWDSEDKLNKLQNVYSQLQQRLQSISNQSLKDVQAEQKKRQDLSAAFEKEVQQDIEKRIKEQTEAKRKLELDKELMKKQLVEYIAEYDSYKVSEAPLDDDQETNEKGPNINEGVNDSNDNNVNTVEDNVETVSSAPDTDNSAGPVPGGDSAAAADAESKNCESNVNNDGEDRKEANSCLKDSSKDDDNDDDNDDDDDDDSKDVILQGNNTFDNDNLNDDFDTAGSCTDVRATKVSGDEQVSKNSTVVEDSEEIDPELQAVTEKVEKIMSRIEKLKAHEENLHTKNTEMYKKFNTYQEKLSECNQAFHNKQKSIEELADKIKTISEQNAQLKIKLASSEATTSKQLEKVSRLEKEREKTKVLNDRMSSLMVRLESDLNITPT